jgi:actin-like ATPase involved in cell morphogenesis
MFKSPKVYLQLRRNAVTAVNLETGERVTRPAIRPFSTQRVVLASFDPAKEAISTAIGELQLKKSLFGIKVVIQQLEGAEGGLSDIEKRALRDIAEMTGGKKVFIFEGETELSIAEALAIVDDG